MADKQRATATGKRKGKVTAEKNEEALYIKGDV